MNEAPTPPLAGPKPSCLRPSHVSARIFSCTAWEPQGSLHSGASPPPGSVMFGLSHRTAQTLTVDRKGAAEAALYGHAGSGVDGGGGGPRSGCAWQGRIAALYGSESSSVLSDISRDYVFFLSSIQSIITVPRLKKKGQTTPVFLPGESHGQGRLVGYSPWGHKESDAIEQQRRCLKVSRLLDDFKRSQG